MAFVMYRVLAVIFLAYAICFPRIASDARTDLAQLGPSRFEQMAGDLQAWIARPIDLIIAALYKQPPG